VSRGLPRTAQLGLLAGPLLTMIDSSIVNVAAPDIGRELHAGLGTVQWVVSGYLLALATGLAATAWAARRWGTLPVYTASLVGFVGASALCAAAPGVGPLIAGRLLQGLAGAPLVPLAMSVLLGRGEGARRVPVAAGVLLFLGPALGPTLGGLLVAAGGWRWIFLVNVPVGVVGAFGLRRVPPGVAPGPQPGRDGTRERLDVVGLVLLAAGLPLTLYGTTSATLHGWTDTATIMTLGAGLALLAAYVGHALRHPRPVVALALVRAPGSALALALCVAASVVAFGAVFLLPVFTETVQHHSVLATGLALLPQGVLTGVGTGLGSRLAGRVAVRWVVTGGFAVLTVAGSGLLLLAPGTPLWVTAAILSGRAVAVGFVVTPLLVVMLAGLAERDLADGNTLFSIAQRLGGSIGVGLLGSLLAARTARVGAVGAFHETGGVLTVLAAVAAAAAPRLRSGAPATSPAATSPAATSPAATSPAAASPVGVSGPRGRSRRPPA